MKLQQFTTIRIYLTLNNANILNEIINEISSKLQKEYGTVTITAKKSENVRNFMYIEIKRVKRDAKKEIEKILEEKGISQAKIDIVMVKEPT